MRSNDPLVWIDCELEVLDEKGWDSIIHHDKTTLDQMDDWCTKTHGDSGLTEACIKSTIAPEQAANGLLDYIKRFVTEPRRGLLAGNSVHCDKAFLSKAPYNKVTDYLSYRILDVSSIKEAAKRWAPEEVLLGVPPKKLLHQAREDILESIEEARYYRAKCFAR
ncbi:oligoribonuclease, partial [Lecanoromycetidae sp. Uapishka_2]